MKKSRFLPGVGVLAISAFVLFGADGCQLGGNDISDSQEREQAVNRQNQNRLSEQYPVPEMDTSLERDVLVQMYVLRNEARNTWSVITSDGTGTPMYDCPSVGFPIANDVRLTNPEQLVDLGSTYDDITMPQAEPNGLYPASSSWGTWVLCINEDGSLNPIYNEMDTLTFPFPISVDYATGRITRIGDPSMVVTLSDPAPALRTP